MTKDQFNAALARCIAIEADRNRGVPCYPFIGIGGDADNFHAWDNDRQVLLCGVFSEVINQDAIDRAVAVAAKSSQDDDRVDIIPCVIAPHSAPLTASSEDVLLYYVAMNAGGMLSGTLEFTDYQIAYWDDDDLDESEDDQP